MELLFFFFFSLYLTFTSTKCYHPRKGFYFFIFFGVCVLWGRGVGEEVASVFQVPMSDLPELIKNKIKCLTPSKILLHMYD